MSNLTGYFSAPALPAPGLDLSASAVSGLMLAQKAKVIRKKLHYRLKPDTSPMRFFAASRTIFVRIPKNASNSILAFLYPDILPKQLPHFGADFYRQVFPREFAEYLVFAPLRDPLERFASAFTYYKETSEIPQERRLMDGPLSFIETFEDFLIWLNGFDKLTDAPIMNWHHFRTQRDYICDRSGRVIVDLLFPVDDMRSGLEVLRNFTDRRGDVPVLNTSRKQDLAGLPLARVRDHYREDIAIWDRLKRERVLFPTNKIANPKFPL